MTAPLECDLFLIRMFSFLVVVLNHFHVVYIGHMLGIGLHTLHIPLYTGMQVDSGAKMTGTAWWMAPELIPKDNQSPTPSEKSDVWYVGISLQVEKSFLQNEGGYRDGSKHEKVKNKGSLHS